MIIDLSYFKGDLLLPQISTAAVAEAYNRAIGTYEPEYLTKALGYQLGQDFLAGIQLDPVPIKWQNLLVGATFTNPNTSRTQKWIGFASVQGGYQFSQTAELTFIVGTTAGLVAGQTSFTTARLLNRAYWIERRGFGYMIPGTDVAISNTGQTWDLLMAGDEFQPAEIFVIHFTGNITPSTTSSINLSPIANYVYWKIREYGTTLTTPTGEVVADNENSSVITPGRKMCSSWNNMVSYNYTLWMFLWVNKTTYGLSESDFNSFWKDGQTWYYLKDADILNMGNTVNDFDL